MPQGGKKVLANIPNFIENKKFTEPQKHKTETAKEHCAICEGSKYWPLGQPEPEEF